jgi:hypothetical protein
MKSQQASGVRGQVSANPQGQSRCPSEGATSEAGLRGTDTSRDIRSLGNTSRRPWKYPGVCRVKGKQSSIGQVWGCQ